MKHMWSEEELKEAIESNKTILEGVVDSLGRRRFIIGNGEFFNISGMSILTCKWCLNGTNLIFEILGSFSQNVDSNMWLFSFEIPEWIYNKITTVTGDIIDSIEYTCAGLTAGITKSNGILYKASNNTILFVQGINISITDPVFFKIKWDTIIDTK